MQLNTFLINWSWGGLHLQKLHCRYRYCTTWKHGYSIIDSYNMKASKIVSLNLTTSRGVLWVDRIQHESIENSITEPYNKCRSALDRQNTYELYSNLQKIRIWDSTFGLFLLASCPSSFPGHICNDLLRCASEWPGLQMELHQELHSVYCCLNGYDSSMSAEAHHFVNKLFRSSDSHSPN